VLAPILVATITYLCNWSWPTALAAATTGATYWKAGPLHLWFLEYLLLFYPVMLGIDWLVRGMLGSSALHAVSRLFRWILRSRGRALFMALVTVGPQATMGGWLTTPTAFEPDPRIFITYLLFFSFGWALYFARDTLEEIKRGGGMEMLLGVGLTVLGYGVLLDAVPGRVWLFAGPLETWLFIFGFTSLFLRYLDRPIAWVRYLADSSYWLYLLHVPVLIWIQVLIAPLPLPALLKGLLALVIAMPLLLASYHLLVRHTWIGTLLNGRR
jgi:peptidoglycan/LPS O-acetylase OafA/YrhL